MKRRRRWSDHDKHFGPFTFAAQDGRRFGLTFDSGDSEYPGASLRAHALRCTLILALPSIVRPGSEYGAVAFEDALHLHYGPQTFDSATTRSKVWFLPWKNWRHVRHSVYGLDGSHYHTQDKSKPWGAWFEIRKTCPSMSFWFDDYDGERICARTHIEEMEWHLGTGAFRWLSAIRRPRISRSLEIEFSKETGKRKGSWKGGTIGHSIEMLSGGGLHEAAFRRYCAEHEMAFVGRSEDVK